MWLRAPYLKKRGFSPMPIVRGGIPREADTRINSKVRGTPPWESFWRDQIYCILHGFQTGGWFLPGRYYYYLNFNDMSTADGIRNPDMCDLHLELCYFMEHCFSKGMNGIIPKKRRAGVTEVFHKAGLDYGWRFFPGFSAGVAAGRKTYADEFIRKWKVSEAMLVPELSIKRLKSAEKLIIAGYNTKNDLGEMVERGTKNTIQIETMFQDPDLFKGTYMNIVIAEECGQFSKLEDFYEATKACVRIGEVQKGSMFFFGTGGRMDKESKGLKEMWEKPDLFNCEKFEILAPRFHFPYYGGASNADGEIIQKVPNLLEQFKPHEIIGMEDQLAAKAALIKERDILFKYGRTEKYQKHLKDYPFSVADIFTKTVTNVFDTESMQNQVDVISAQTSPQYIKCQLDPKKDDKGEIITPMQLELRIDNETPEDGDCILIHKDFILGINSPSIKGFSNLLSSGVDSYDQDKAKTSKSKGAMCVLIRVNTIAGQMQRAPIATICCRPRRKEIFYEMCLRLSIYFGLNQAVLIDVANKLIFKYFEERGYSNLLSYRPKKLESEDSQQTNTYGFHINNHSKQVMVGLMQGAILDYSKYIHFPELLNQLQNYDEVEIGSDNDLADAYGIALVQDNNEEVGARKSSEYTDENIYNLPEWRTDSNGNKVMYNPSAEIKIISEEQDYPGRFLSS